MKNKFLALSLLGLFFATGLAQADIIASQLGSTSSANRVYNGQGVVTSSGGPWNNISFSFDSSSGATTTNYADGDLFILSNVYSGTPAALSSSTTGFITQSTGITLGRWVFDSSVVLNPNTTYYFLMGDRPSAVRVRLFGDFDGSAPGLFFADCATCNYRGNNNDFDHILSGDIVSSDSDGDGVVDDDDNCPNVANPGQEDQDGDDVGDVCDDDIDGDGVNNVADNCPIDVNAGQEDFDGDTIGDACDDDIDGDSVANDGDYCPDNTVIHEGVPTMGDLKPNHWALTVTGNGFDFDTLIKGKGPNRSYTIEDTAGCSCEQIIEIQGLGDGHTKHGCSISAMDDWIDFVNP